VIAALFAAAAVTAVADWIAVHQRLFRVEYLVKPATLAVLLAAACVADLGPAHPWVITALACGLVGDVGLMRSVENRTDAPFLVGLGAFLLGHIAYIAAFARHGVRGLDVLAGVLVVAGVAGLALPAVLRGAARAAGRAFAALVAGYATVLSAMTVLGVGTGVVATAVGATLFLCSDTVLARERFVARMRYGSLLVIVTYHLAQGLILLGLVRTW
jgi:uncharacterized membrane protein YhhN